LLFKDREIRRCYFFETIARQKYNIFLDFKDISWKNTNCFARCITHFSNIFIFEKKFHINLSKNKPLNSLKFMGLAFEHCLFLQLVCTLTLFYSLRREELDTTRSRELLEDSTFPSGSEKKQRKDNLLRLLITLLIGRTLSIKTTWVIWLLLDVGVLFPSSSLLRCSHTTESWETKHGTDISTMKYSMKVSVKNQFKIQRIPSADSISLLLMAEHNSKTLSTLSLRDIPLLLSDLVKNSILTVSTLSALSTTSKISLNMIQLSSNPSRQNSSKTLHSPSTTAQTKLKNLKQSSPNGFSPRLARLSKLEYFD